MKFLSAVLVLIPASVQAHAMLQGAMPPVGSVVAVSPAALQLNFDNALDPVRSRVSVTDAAGTPETAGALRVDPANAGHLLVPISKLGSGTYTVRWVAISTDLHRTQGSYHFRVAP